MRQALVVLAAVATLAACSAGEDTSTAEETVAKTSPSSSSSSSPSSSSSSAPTSSKAPASTSAQSATPEQEFLTAMRASGIVPQFGSEADVIDLATTICLAYGSGQSFVQVMNTLAGGSMSLTQMMDLNQAATEHYCPRFFVPES